MSGRRRQQVSPTLFPFLAVLVCTLGTLILFLALVAQKATTAAEQQLAEAAEQQRSSDPEPQTPSLSARTVNSMIAEEEFRVTQVAAFRDEQAAELEERRDHLTHIEDHLQRLRDELIRLSDEVKMATGEAEATNMDAAQVEAIKQQLQQEQKTVEELKKQAENKTPRVVIVPHKGPNGTARRPVYLECTKQGVVLWPEGSVITHAQLENSSRGANPVDAALRIIRHHAMQNYGDSIPPYPLIVVRPDGIENYAVTRMAMEDWDDQFGYELVPAEVELAFNRPDPMLKKRMDEAIANAISNQRVITQVARASSGRAGPLPTLSAAQLDRQGRTGGFRSAKDVPAMESDYTNTGTSNRSGAWPANDYGKSHSNTNENTSIAAGPSSGSAQYGATPATGSGPALTPTQLREIEQRMKAAAEEAHRSNSLAQGMAQGSPQGLAQDATQPHATANDSGQLGTLGSFLNQPHATMDSRHSDGTNESFGSTKVSNLSIDSANGPASASPGNNSVESATDSGSSLTLGGPEGLGNASQATDSMASSEKSNQHNQTLAPERQFEMPDSGDPFAKSSGSGTGGTSMQASSGQQASAASAEMAASGGQSQSAPSSDQPMGSSAATNNENVVKREGRDWGLPNHVARMKGNQIVRTIRVVCNKDQYILLAPATGGATEVFGVTDESFPRATSELVTAVRDRISDWGPTLPGGRWQPVLEVEVMPGGEQRFEQLQQWMRGSGVDVQGRTSN